MILVSLLWLAFWWLLAVAALIVFNFGVARFLERLVPPVGRFVEIDGLRLHIVDSGDKPGQELPPLLCLHGLLGELNHYSYALAGLFPERRVVLLDRPGCGYSQLLPEQSLLEQAEIAAKLIDLLQLHRPVAVGHSLGGAVAVALALKYPQKLGGLALIAPLTHRVAAPPKAFEMLGSGRPWAIWLWAWTFGPAMSFLSSGMTREKIFGPDPMPADFWNRGGGLLATRPSAIIGASRDLRGQSRELRGMEPGYASLALPIGVLYADDCLLDPKVQGESFCAKAPGAELTRVAGGHMLPVTQPKTCETFIRLVLARL